LSTSASIETTAPGPEGAATTRTLLFRVAGRVYGCDIDVVREIIPFRRATRLPGAPSYVQGLINLRGTIVTVLDLGRRIDPARPLLGSAPATEGDDARDGHTGEGRGKGGDAEAGSIILVEHGPRLVGVAVDEVMDVRPVEAERIETPSGDTRGSAGGGLVRGLGELEGDVVVLLDIHMLVTQVLL
jgi:purine-binding chemotaxis protein CheW